MSKKPRKKPVLEQDFLAAKEQVNEKFKEAGRILKEAAKLCDDFGIKGAGEYGQFTGYEEEGDEEDAADHIAYGMTGVNDVFSGLTACGWSASSLTC